MTFLQRECDLSIAFALVWSAKSDYVVVVVGRDFCRKERKEEREKREEKCLSLVGGFQVGQNGWRSIVSVVLFCLFSVRFVLVFGRRPYLFLPPLHWYVTHSCKTGIRRKRKTKKKKPKTRAFSFG